MSRLTGDEQCRDRRGDGKSHGRGREQGAKKQRYFQKEKQSTMDEPVGGGRGHCRRRRETIGGAKQASAWWVRLVRKATRGWREGDVLSMGTLYHTAAATSPSPP